MLRVDDVGRIGGLRISPAGVVGEEIWSGSHAPAANEPSQARDGVEDE